MLRAWSVKDQKLTEYKLTAALSDMRENQVELINSHGQNKDDGI